MSTAVSSSRGFPKLGLGVAALALIADQLSKYVMIERVMRPEGEIRTPFFTDKLIEVLPFFQLRLSWNDGMSFSLFSSGGPTTFTVLVIVKIVISLGLIWYLPQLENRWQRIACGLIIGGAIGNVMDDLRFGAVADFLDFYWGTWHFPTFNVADSCISVGAALWLLDAVLIHPQSTAPIADQTIADQTKD